MHKYIWQSETWPRFTWDDTQLVQPLSRCRLLQGKLLGRLASIDFKSSRESYAELLIEETLQTACIEGQILDRESVRSSVARRLGIGAAMTVPDRKTDALVELLMDATENYDTPLTAARLKGWQAGLFPTGYSGIRRIAVGQWRGPDPMQIVSGPVGRETVHYEAPPFDQVEEEMTRFLQWWAESLHTAEGILRAGVAHFWFVAIYPFEDGNGRIARAITDMALAQDEGVRRRFYSLSAQIMAEREKYYTILERTQKGDGDITRWLVWFLECFGGAIENSEKMLHNILVKSAFWNRHAQTPMSERQRKAVNRLLDAGKGGFEGGLTTRKYVSMTKVSRATAQREIRELVEKSVLVPNPGGGRSASYDLAWPEI